MACASPSHHNASLARPLRQYLQALSPVVVSVNANITVPTNAPMGSYIDASFSLVRYKDIRSANPTELPSVSKTFVPVVSKEGMAHPIYRIPALE